MQLELSGAQSNLLVSAPPFSLNFAVSARMRGSFALEELQAALESLRHMHPLLAVRISAGGNGSLPCFTTDGVPPISLRVVERILEKDWVGEVEREISQPSNYLTGPLFRCVWLRGLEVSELVLVCDHVTADGYAAIYALRDLLRLLADPHLFFEPCLPEKMAELVPPAMLEKIKEVTSAPSEAVADEPPGFLDAGPRHPLSVVPIEFNESETSALVVRCRQEGVTVQSALCAAFASLFAERELGQPLRWIEIPINIRGRLLKSVEGIYGNYISLVYTGVDCPPGRNEWDIARQVSQDLAAITDEQLFTIPIVMIAVADKPLTIPIVQFNYDISISNLGRVNIPEQYGSLYLESIYGPTMNVTAPTQRILGVTTFGGRMRCTFTSRDPEAPYLVKRSREIIAAMSENSSKGRTLE